MAGGKRLSAALAAAAVVALGALAPTSEAQLPPELQPPLEVVSPIAAPACGNAILGATIVAGTAPPEAREAIELATANIFVVCGSIPIPPTAPTHCVDDEVLAAVLAQLGGATIGGALPVSPPGAGQVIDAIRILQERFPLPADDESLLASAAAALECRFASVSAPAPGRTPTAPEDTTGGPVVEDGSPVLVPIGTGPPIPAGVLPSYVEDLPTVAAPVMPSSASGPKRPVSHPIWIAPVIVALAGLVVGRGLLSRNGIE